MTIFSGRIIPFSRLCYNLRFFISTIWRSCRLLVDDLIFLMSTIWDSWCQRPDVLVVDYLMFSISTIWGSWYRWSEIVDVDDLKFLMWTIWGFCCRRSENLDVDDEGRIEESFVVIGWNWSNSIKFIEERLFKPPFLMTNSKMVVNRDTGCSVDFISASSLDGATCSTLIKLYFYVVFPF